MEERSAAVGVADIEVLVNVNNKSVSVNPSNVTIHVDQTVKFHLAFTGGVGSTQIRAYVVLLKTDSLEPTEETSRDGYQDTLFALRDTAGNDTPPTFVAKKTATVNVPVMALFPEGANCSISPTNSVVIIDW